MMRGEAWVQAIDDRLEVIRRASRLDPTNGGLAVRFDKGTYLPTEDPLCVAEVITKEFVEFCIRARLSIPLQMTAMVRPENDKPAIRSKFLETDWAEWSATPLIALWEAAALSLQIRPELFELSKSNDKRMVLRDNDEADWDTLHEVREDFDRRTRMLVRAAAVGQLGDHYDRDGCFSNRIWSCFSFAATDKVVAYFDSCGIDVPKGWRPAKVSKAPPGKWPWGDYENDNLRALADAVKQWWSTYEPWPGGADQ
jgi:hypothetical protein